jgi:hypothetical protein
MMPLDNLHYILFASVAAMFGLTMLFAQVVLKKEKIEA